jgi:uncharacterized protein YbjQ (UPF0145 family)
MSILMLSTNQLPAGTEVKLIYSMIQLSSKIEISSKGLIRSLTEGSKNEYQEALEQFGRLAPADANAIIGVQISTTTQQFTNGTFLFITYIGTPALLGDIK